MKTFRTFEGETPIYNLACLPVDLPGTRATLLGCRLAPGESSEAHNHFETEVFIFASGTGIVERNGERVEVGPGDAVLFEGFENHIITNTSQHEPLLFHSVYYPAETGEGEDDDAAAERPAEASETLVFSTPPTPNGDLHLGHLAGPYLAADAMRRTLAGRGGAARHVTGRDDHQTYVATLAADEGIDRPAVADRYAAAIRETWDGFGIALDGFVEPHRDGAYADFVRAGIRQLHDAGLIEARTEAAAVDADGRYLHEAFVTGTCPHCGCGCDGNACEACGRPNQCVDMIDASPRGTGTPVRRREVTRLYFKLSAFADRLAQYVKSAAMPAHVAALSLEMIDDGLPDICISHPGDWGIAHDIEGFEDQRVYVWFEMAFGYLWGAAGADTRPDQDVLAAARAVYNGGGAVVHCYGFDNSYYHTLLFPAVHMALGLVPAQTHVVNELLDLDGEKFSTSRRHLILGRDFAAALPTDYARYALLARRPEGERGNFTVEDTRAELNRVFAEDLNRAVADMAALAGAFDDTVPEPGAWLADHSQFHAWLQGQARLFAMASDRGSFSPRLICRVMADTIAETRRFLASQAPIVAGAGRSGRNYARTAVALGAAALRFVADVSAGVTPELSDDLMAFLGQARDGARATGGIVFLDPGTAIVPAAAPDLPEVPDDLARRVAPARPTLTIDPRSQGAAA